MKRILLQDVANTLDQMDVDRFQRSEPEKAQKTATKKSSCSGGSNCSTDGSSRWRRHHKEECGSSRSNCSIRSTRKNKDEEILSIIQGRQMIGKHEKERIREVSKKIK